MNKKYLLTTVIAIIVFTILVMHTMRYYPFLSDDALISLRYVDRFLQGDGLTWTDGKPVEGYSNLLWILLVALIGLSGLDLVTAARVLGYIWAGLTLAALFYHFRRHKVLTSLFSSVFLVLSGPVAIWTIGGLEQPLVAGLLAWAIVLFIKNVQEKSGPSLWLSGLFFGLLCLSRPDGILFTLFTGLAAVVIFRFSTQSLATVVRLFVFPVLLYTSQLIFRLLYYGEWFPNTALVKFSPSIDHAGTGLSYISGALSSIFPVTVLFILFFVALLAKKTSRHNAIFFIVNIVGWLAYIVVIGGDYFPGWRHFFPILVLMALVLGEGIELLLNFLKSRWVILLTWAVIAFSFFLFFKRQNSNYENMRARFELWEWEGKEIGLFLKKAFGESNPTTAVDIAGSIPYWSELPSIDMLGLNDYYLPRHKPVDFGSKVVGHELGSGKYLLESRPDIIIFNLGQWDSEHITCREVMELAEFKEIYTPVRFTPGNELEYLFWIDRNSPKIGINRTESEIRLPAYLLNGNEYTLLSLSGEGRPVITITSEKQAMIREHEMTEGTWKLIADSSDDVTFRYFPEEHPDVTRVYEHKENDFLLKIHRRTAVSIIVTPVEDTAVVMRALIFRKVNL